MLDRGFVPIRKPPKQESMSGSVGLRRSISGEIDRIGEFLFVSGDGRAIWILEGGGIDEGAVPSIGDEALVGDEPTGAVDDVVVDIGTAVVADDGSVRVYGSIVAAPDGVAHEEGVCHVLRDHDIGNDIIGAKSDMPAIAVKGIRGTLGIDPVQNATRSYGIGLGIGGDFDEPRTGANGDIASDKDRGQGHITDDEHLLTVREPRVVSLLVWKDIALAVRGEPVDRGAARLDQLPCRDISCADDLGGSRVGSTQIWLGARIGFGSRVGDSRIRGSQVRLDTAIGQGARVVEGDSAVEIWFPDLGLGSAARPGQRRVR